MEEELEAGACRDALRHLGVTIWHAAENYQPTAINTLLGVGITALVSGRVRSVPTNLGIFDAVKEYPWKIRKG